MRNAGLVFGVLCLGVSTCEAAPRVVPRAVQLQTGLVIVPFAVPVAVPVAVVQSPTVVYGYRVPVSAPTPSEAAAAHRREEPAGSPVAAMFARHCAACHTAGAAQGGFELFTADGRLRDKFRRQAIVEAVTPNESGVAQMPPAGRTQLTADELRAIESWARPPRELEW